MPTILYQKLTLSDFQQWNDLRAQALDLAPEAFGRSNADEGPLRKELFGNNVGKEDRFILGAFSANDLIGIAGLFQFDAVKAAHKSMIWSVFVKPKFHGKGIGKQRMQRIIEMARKIKGVELIQIGVGANNTAAKNLYENLGFVEYGMEPHSLKIEGKYYDETLLWLDLEMERGSQH